MKAGHRKSKISVALAALAVSAVLLTTASFAWYTISTKAEAGDLAIVFRGIKWPFEAGYTKTVQKTDAEGKTVYEPVQETDAEGKPVVDAEGNPVYEIAWAKELNVSQYLQQLGLDRCVLRPISTYDLTHWYTAQYSVAGSVNGFEEVPLAAVANVPVKYATADDAAGSIKEGDETDGNCLIYFDLWIRETNEGEQAGLKLSTVEPRLLSGGGFTFGDALVSETVEGTFVLTKPSVGADGKYAARKSGDGYTLTDGDSQADALNSVRIGFAALDENDEIVSYFIYEPNADRHNEAHKGAAAGDDTLYVLHDLQQVDTGIEVGKYKSSYAMSGSAGSRFTDFQGIKEKLAAKTAPLVSTVTLSGGAAGQEYRENVSEVKQFANGEQVKLTDASTGPFGKTYDLLYTYVPTLVKRPNEQTGAPEEVLELHPQQTVRQLGSDWDMAKVQTKYAKAVDGQGLNSTDVKSFGQFIDEVPALCTVKNGESMKMRVFLWIEGQDVDCWNQIVGGSILANLEFTGVEITDISPSSGS